MPVYITQGRYTREALEGMLNKPEDRAKAVEALAKAAGAKLLHYYVTYGEYDFLVIMESGKNRTDTDSLALLMTAATSGIVTDLKTTIGVTSKDAVKAMRTAKKMRSVLKPPGQ